MSKPLDFEFYVGGLEAAILYLLKNGNPQLAQAGMTGVNLFGTYKGQFNRAALLSELKTRAAKLPVVLVAYGSGKDDPNLATGNLYGEKIELEHKHGFVIIVACNNVPPYTTTPYKMIAEVRGLLSGVEFEGNIAEEGEPVVLKPLNHSPLLPAGVETIVRLSDLTAYAVSFTTSFKEWTPSRSVVISATAEEILLHIIPEGDNNITAPDVMPGVKGEIE